MCVRFTMSQFCMQLVTSLSWCLGIKNYIPKHIKVLLTLISKIPNFIIEILHLSNTYFEVERLALHFITSYCYKWLHSVANSYIIIPRHYVYKYSCCVVNGRKQNFYRYSVYIKSYIYRVCVKHARLCILTLNRKYHYNFITISI